MIENISKGQMADYLISNIIDKLVVFLMNDCAISLESALDKVYTSNTIKLLQIPEGELYVQSPEYVYELLRTEIG